MKTSGPEIGPEVLSGNVGLCGINIGVLRYLPLDEKWVFGSWHAKHTRYRLPQKELTEKQYSLL